MMDICILGAFLLGFSLCALTTLGGPVSLASAQRRGFHVGWEAREKYPAHASSKTRAEIARLLAEDEDRLMN